MTEITLIGKLAKIQQELKAPKSQVNQYGRYKYRSAEDILEAVKPLLNGLILLLSDKIVKVGRRYYVKATAIIGDGKDAIEVFAYARETKERKGMDDSQITGTASSYARKYALNGLFAINDEKDADSFNAGRLGGRKTPKTAVYQGKRYQREPDLKEPLDSRNFADPNATEPFPDKAKQEL